MKKLMLGMLVVITALLHGCTPAVHDNIRYIRQTVHPLITNVREETHSSGSAVVIAPGYAITAAHVVKPFLHNPNAELLLIQQTSNTTSKAISVKVVAVDDDHDIAIVRGTFACPCAVVDNENPIRDERVTAIGFPIYRTYGLQIATVGYVQGVAGDKLATTAPVAPGSSGGGIFVYRNGQYKLTGIVVGMAALPGTVQPHIYSWYTFSATREQIKQLINTVHATMPTSHPFIGMLPPQPF